MENTTNEQQPTLPVWLRLAATIGFALVALTVFAAGTTSAMAASAATFTTLTLPLDDLTGTAVNFATVLIPIFGLVGGIWLGGFMISKLISLVRGSSR